MNLQEAVKKINFNDIKENYQTVKIKVKNSEWLKSIEFEHCEATTIYDKTGFTYCLNLKCMPFTSYPMRNANYIQTYKSVKRMLNTLFKNVKSDIEVELV